MNDTNGSADPSVAPTVVPARPRPGTSLLPLVLGICLVAMAAVWFQTRQELSDQRVLTSAAASAESAGSAAAEHMLTYDHRTLDEDFAWVERDGTPEFVEVFKDPSDTVRELARATRATSMAEVRASATDVADATHVSVLVFADQVLVDAKGKHGQRWRMKLEMVQKDGRWLVDLISWM